MRNDTIDSFLRALAARVPAPGGGATAALHAAQAAALVAMVARYSDGRPVRRARRGDHAGARERTSCAMRALDLAEADAAAFTAVTDAYRLPEGAEGSRARSAAIAHRLAGAVPPACRRHHDCRIGPRPRRAAAADRQPQRGQRRARPPPRPLAPAATTARVNVEINLGGIIDADTRDELREACRRSTTSRRGPRR